MRRAFVLCLLIAVGALSMAVAAYQRPIPPNQVLEVEKVKDNLYILKGIFTEDPKMPGCPPNCRRGGGNTAVFITASGVVLVDTKDPGWGKTILDRVKTLTDKPVTMVINTHTHADHTGNNTYFPAPLEIVTQEKTKANMERMDLFRGEGSKGLPTKTFKDKLSLFSGKDRIDLYYFGRGHTNGDAFVVFPALHAMHTGDMFPFQEAMVINFGDGGSALEFPQTLAKASAGIRDVEIIITGHGPILPWKALDQYQHFNGNIATWTQEAIKAGKSVDDAAALINQRLFVSGKYTGYQPQLYRIKQAVQNIYDEVRGPPAKR